MKKKGKRDGWSDTKRPVPPVRESLFEYRGYPCAVLLMPWGCRCGYVGLKKGSKYYQKGIYDIPVDCHGGLTYAENYLIGVNPSGDNQADSKFAGLWWIGFDCAHWKDANDFPALYAAFANYPQEIERIANLQAVEKKFGTTGEVRTIEFCEAECRSIVDQLIAEKDQVLEDNISRFYDIAPEAQKKEEDKP